jgi:hypothetical protein
LGKNQEHVFLRDIFLLRIIRLLLRRSVYSEGLYYLGYRYDISEFLQIKISRILSDLRKQEKGKVQKMLLVLQSFDI